jgi:hypothetical protein
VHSTDDCWALCNSSTAPCHSFAYHHLDHPNKVCAGGCYGLHDGVYQPHAEIKASSGKGPRHYNGPLCSRPAWASRVGHVCCLNGIGVRPQCVGSKLGDHPCNGHWPYGTVCASKGVAAVLFPRAYHRAAAAVCWGGGYVIYKIGCADGAITGSNGTGLVGPCTCCHNGTTDADCNCPAPDQTHERTCQDVLHSRTLYRPWERVNSGMPNWDWRDLNLGFESMAPVVLGNGTILSLTRSWGTPAPYPNSAFWLVRGSAWSGTYAKVNPAVAAQPFLPVTMGGGFVPVPVQRRNWPFTRPISHLGPHCSGCARIFTRRLALTVALCACLQ